MDVSDRTSAITKPTVVEVDRGSSQSAFLLGLAAFIGRITVPIVAVALFREAAVPAAILARPAVLVRSFLGVVAIALGTARPDLR
jgi:hypothetical protein